MLKVKSCKTISGRKKILQDYLTNSNSNNVLPVEDDAVLKYLFDKYYTPDKCDRKYEQEIDRFYISTHPTFRTKCFNILLKDGTTHVASLSRLSGSNRTENQNITSAMRNAIQPQIMAFKRDFPLNPLEICPIADTPLGNDAEVDHHKPIFSILMKDWITGLGKIPVAKFMEDKLIYELEEPFLSLWCAFHKEHAVLRWLSKAGNKIAHLDKT